MALISLIPYKNNLLNFPLYPSCWLLVSDPGSCSLAIISKSLFLLPWCCGNGWFEPPTPVVHPLVLLSRVTKHQGPGKLCLHCISREENDKENTFETKCQDYLYWGDKMMRLVKLGAQVVFRNYIDLASHDFYLRLCDLGFFFEQRNIKKDRWMEEGK